MKNLIILLAIFAVISFAPDSFSQPISQTAPQAEETPGPESLIPPGAKMLNVQWGNFRGTKAHDLLILYRKPDLSGTHAAVYTRHKGRFFLLWEQAYPSMVDFYPDLDVCDLDPQMKIPYLILAPYAWPGMDGKVFLYQWNGKTFGKIPGAEVPMESVEIQDLKGDKNLELVCVEKNGEDRVYALQKGILRDVSGDFPEYYERPAGSYYPEKAILLGVSRINRLDIYMIGHDPAGNLLSVPKPAARLWLVDGNNKDFSVNIPDFEMRGFRFTARMTDPTFGTLSIAGRFLDDHFRFKTKNRVHHVVLNCDFRFAGTDNKRLYLADNPFTY